MNNRESSAEIDDAAATWAVRLDDGHLPEADRAELDDWLDGDTRRLGAFVRAQAALAQVRRLKALGTRFDPEVFDAGSQNTDLTVTKELPTHVTRRRVLFGTGAAAAAVAIAVFFPTRHASAQVFRTGKGELRTLSLGPRQALTLNSDSEVELSGHESRWIANLLRGEVLLDLGGDPSASDLIVRAKETKIEAQRAQFSLSRLDGQPMELAVSSGSVDLVIENGAREVGLGANTVTTIAASGLSTRPVPPALLVRELAWRQGMLSFADAPLAEATREFARYSDRRVVLADGSIGRETVTGMFAANDPEGFARAAALSLGLKVESTPGAIVLIR